MSYRDDIAKGRRAHIDNENVAYDKDRDAFKTENLSSSNGSYGLATGGSATILEDSLKNWEDNMWDGAYIEILSGTGTGQVRKIASNTSNTITVSTSFDVAPDSTSVYRIFQNLIEILSVEQEIRDELSRPNEDILVPDTPAADTDYIVTVDMARGVSFVGALYSDVAPDSVKVEGSIDSTNFYEMDGIDIDVSTWSTSKLNVYKIEPYARYMRFVLHTGSSAPSKVIMIARGVRS